VFLRLARDVAGRAAVDRRWPDLLDVEAEVARAQAPGPRLFSWPAG
jgi:hypothetical protein